MNNQRRAYAERRRVLEGQDLKEQVIKYAEKTMDEIVDYYQPRPAFGRDLNYAVSKVKEFYLFAFRFGAKSRGSSVGEIKTFLHEQVQSDLRLERSALIKSSLINATSRAVLYFAAD